MSATPYQLVLTTPHRSGSKIQNSYTLYSDAGDGYEESRLDRFYLIGHEKSLELMWEQQGNYGFPYQSVQLHVHGVSLQQAWVDDRETTVQGQQLQCHFFKQVHFATINDRIC